MVPRILYRAFRRQRRAYSDGTAKTPRTPFESVKDKDEQVYGGLKSWEILTSEQHAQGVRDMTKKPLWHVWQLVTASAVPLGAWFYLEQVEAKERERGTRTLAGDEASGMQRGQTVNTSVSQDGSADNKISRGSTSLAELEQRLARVERQLDSQGIREK